MLHEYMWCYINTYDVWNNNQSLSLMGQLQGYNVFYHFLVYRLCARSVSGVASFITTDE